jgi:deoxycytidine triphosphate deaminase
MILNDADIRGLTSSANLLTEHDPDNIRNCAYTLRASSVFRPETGEQELLNVSAGSRRQLLWEIGPAETLVVMTRENITMPSDVCGTYAPLFRLAKQGVMLLNASIVEPGYSGPLSCFLANFSAGPVTLRQDAPIAKILFHKISGPPAEPKPEVIERRRYEEDLAEDARRYHRSFMDVSGIEDRAAKKARSELKGLLIIGGAIIAVLLAWASLEPVLSKWIWEKTGFISATQRAEDVRLLKDIQNEQAVLKLQLEQKKANDDVAEQIQRLKREVETLKRR